MATYNSDLMNARTVVRPDGLNGGVQTIRSTLKIPAGVDVIAGDIAKMIRLDYGVVPLRFIVNTDRLDTSTGLTVQLGIYQIAPGTSYPGTNSSGVLVALDVAAGVVTTAAGYASPSTVVAYFQDTAGSIQTIMRASGGGVDSIDLTGADGAFATLPRTGFTGPVDIAFTFPVGASGTTATTDRYVTVYMDYMRKPDNIADPQVDRGGY